MLRSLGFLKALRSALAGTNLDYVKLLILTFFEVFKRISNSSHRAETMINIHNGLESIFTYVHTYIPIENTAEITSHIASNA